VKSAAIRAVLGGRSRTEIENWTREFVSKLLVGGLHEDALAALEAHRRAGDLLVLLSASPDLYVPAIGRALGCAQSVCTEVEWQGDRLGGRLRTPNRRGAEKAGCIATLRRDHPGLKLIAYGNATSDLEHLVLADQATLVNGALWARQAAARQNVDCVTWR
jgi:phosphatidylglycerophosphatase C